MFLVGFLIALTAKSCYDCRYLLLKIKSSIHSIDVINNEYELNETIEHFAMQMDHERICFSANGIFNIDYEYMTDLLSLITSFFLIFIQFKPNEKI